MKIKNSVIGNDWETIFGTALVVTFANSFINQFQKPQNNYW